jgi:hypothetical protein
LPEADEREIHGSFGSSQGDFVPLAPPSAAIPQMFNNVIYNWLAAMSGRLFL